MFNENDVDWVPSKNLTNLDQQEEHGMDNVESHEKQNARLICKIFSC